MSEARAQADVHKLRWSRLWFVATAIVLAVAVGWALMAVLSPRSTGVDDPSMGLFPVFGDLRQVGVEDPSVGRELALPEDQGRPEVSTLVLVRRDRRAIRDLITFTVAVDPAHDRATSLGTTVGTAPPPAVRLQGPPTWARYAYGSSPNPPKIRSAL